ncbi:hypothetical protein GCM10011487_65430 [Steroidobacter agaridevorans]|uniref:Uncharacterized protein n=1 Tax=Steroidobacter agaridevorans TaxID=2695856 RepID=A0A829YP12_9GAMM|nr:hypothetical protein GCM10011487_65430 [Steroidobacter agaridevorans]GFE90942.1 hypothetical protein GCM10011488_58960 [Steroidobacter agaridevorans]
MAPAQLLLVAAIHDLDDVALELGLAQVAELDRQQVAMHSQHGRQADREMDVGAALVGAELQKGVYSGHAKKLRFRGGREPTV